MTTVQNGRFLFNPVDSCFSVRSKKIRILYTEDYPITRKAFYMLLTKAGFIVDLATNGEETWQQYLGNNYHLILLDGGLPDVTGFEVAKRIRRLEKNERRKRTSIILLSAYPYDLVKEECDTAGVDKFLIKPVDFGDLRNVMDSMLFQMA